MPFNQQMSFPYELTLRRFGLSLELCARPVREIEALRGASRVWNELAVKPGDNPLADLAGELWDIEAEIAPGSATDFGFVLYGRPVTFRVKEKQLSNGDASAGLSPANDRVRLRILVDRTSVEVFGNDGEVVIPCCFLPDGTKSSLEFFSHGGTAQIVSLKLHALKSIWR
jgi:sucrose-6-phosphate hydrolase SacC (GH32 family)